MQPRLVHEAAPAAVLSRNTAQNSAPQTSEPQGVQTTQAGGAPPKKSLLHRAVLPVAVLIGFSAVAGSAVAYQSGYIRIGPTHSVPIQQAPQHASSAQDTGEHAQQLAASESYHHPEMALKTETNTSIPNPSALKTVLATTSVAQPVSTPLPPPPVQQSAAGQDPTPPERTAKLSDTLTKKMDHLLESLEQVQNDIHRQDAQIAQLSEHYNQIIGENSGKIEGRVDELQHREDETSSSMNDVHTTLNALQGKLLELTTPVKPKAVLGHKVTSPPAPPAPPRFTRPVYHVQACATGLAILAGSDGEAKRVEVGQELSGWGRVLSITEQGDRWVIHTEAGDLR